VLFPVVYVAVGISGSKEGDNCQPAILNLLEESTQFQWLIEKEPVNICKRRWVKSHNSELITPIKGASFFLLLSSV